MDDQVIARFRDQFEKYSSIWKSIEIRALMALKGQDWIAIKVMVYLRDFAPQQYDYKITFDDANLKGIIEYRKPEAIWDLITGIQNGKITVGDIQATMGTVPNTRLFYFDIFPSKSGQRPEELFPCIKLYLALDIVSTYVDENEINRLLYSFGYQGGLPELSQAKIGEPVGGGYVSYFGIVAPLYLKLTVQYEPNYVKVFVRYPENVIASDITVRYQFYGTTENQIILNDEIRFSEENKQLQNGEAFLEKTLAVDSNTRSGRLTLFYKNIKPPADFFNLLIGGPKANIITVLETLGKIQDSGARFETVIERLTQWLGVSNRAVDADRFEMALWSVLTLSGLQTINLGRAFGKGFDLQGFDLIIIHQTKKQIVLISCTIDNKLSNKLEALLKESNSVASKMEGWAVIPVVCAPIVRKDVTLGSFRDATQSGISMVLRLEIEEILTTLKEISVDTSERVFEIITRKSFPGNPSDPNAQEYNSWSQDWPGFII